MIKKLCLFIACFIAGTAIAAIEINKATEADLDSLIGIGPVTTQQILTERKKGEFKDWTDLKQRVKGMGDSRATKLSSGGLTVNGASYKEKGAQTSAKSNANKADRTEVKPTMTPAAANPTDKKGLSHKSAPSDSTAINK